jgi:hypothetical protein
MTDETNNMNALIAACWEDDAMKQRFLSDTKAVLAEHGLDMSDDGVNRERLSLLLQMLLLHQMRIMTSLMKS